MGRRHGADHCHRNVLSDPDATGNATAAHRVDTLLKLASTDYTAKSTAGKVDS